jgi:hypothetical protein
MSHHAPAQKPARMQEKRRKGSGAPGSHRRPLKRNLKRPLRRTLKRSPQLIARTLGPGASAGSYEARADAPRTMRRASPRGGA